jgi:Xaa-Pro dipeptidase
MQQHAGFEIILPQPITSAPSREELAARLEAVRAGMAAQDLDIFVCFDPVNVYYLTNFANEVHERPFLLIIKPVGVPTMLVPLLELTHAQERARCELEFAVYDEFPAPPGRNWYDRYVTLLDPRDRIGVEPALPIGIAAKTPGRVVVSDLLEEVRLIKTTYEIGRTVHACQIINLGHRRLLERCRPGAPVHALAAEVRQAMMARILEDIPGANRIVTTVRASVWPPSISHDPHLVPSPTTQLEPGGPHVTGVWGQVDGYGVELERTFFLGQVPEAARRPFEVMMRARSRAYELCVPGANMGHIDRAVKQVLVDGGFGGSRILHRTGHGLGITGHEAPYLAEGYDRELQPGMLISIEPGIYIPGLGGFRHSDSILIDDTGCIPLTQAPDTLDELLLPA